MAKHVAEEWKRQIINAGGDENLAEQAVTIAALNGMFDYLAPQAEQEPVGYLRVNINGNVSSQDFHRKKLLESERWRGWREQPLYAHPPADPALVKALDESNQIIIGLLHENSKNVRETAAKQFDKNIDLINAARGAGREQPNDA
jgi:hypothetical protein